MEKVLNIITSACQYSHGGEPSFRKEAAAIVQSLNNNGYVIVKSDDQSEKITLPTPLEDEGFIEQEISYQHHGVVRAAIVNYKIFLKQRMGRTK